MPPAEALDVARARAAGRPLVIIVFDRARSDADRAAWGASHAQLSDAAIVALDLTTSRNRADAAPLHALDAPTLLCLTPAGTILSRDEGGIDATLIRRRARAVVAASPTMDAERARREAGVAAAPDDVARRSALADYLLAHHNDAEAIPHLRRVADDASADVATRVRAWTAMARAHLWCIEPEKARYAAQSLIDTLGPTSPDAIAGGNLVRGLQDARAKRFGRAREELNAAIAAAAGSPYGLEAAEVLRTLPATTTAAAAAAVGR